MGVCLDGLKSHIYENFQWSAACLWSWIEIISFTFRMIREHQHMNAHLLASCMHTICASFLWVWTGSLSKFVRFPATRKATENDQFHFPTIISFIQRFFFRRSAHQMHWDHLLRACSIYIAILVWIFNKKPTMTRHRTLSDLSSWEICTWNDFDWWKNEFRLFYWVNKDIRAPCTQQTNKQLPWFKDTRSRPGSKDTDSLLCHQANYIITITKNSNPVSII